MIEMHNLTFQYQFTSEPSLQKINLQIIDGEFLLITGASGSGKSTLVRILNGIIPHFYGGKISGKVSVQGLDPIRTETRLMAQKVGFVFQNTENQLFMNTVENELAFGLENMNLPKAEIRTRIDRILQNLGLENLYHKPITQLSGGERQKIAIASILTMEPEVLVIDEPTAELDPKSADDILLFIQELRTKIKITVILIEHRLDRVLKYVDRVILMNHGQIIKDGKPREIFHEDFRNIGISIPPIITLAQYLKLPEIPLSVSDARRLILPLFTKIDLNASLPSVSPNLQIDHVPKTSHLPLIRLENVDFSYDGATWIFKRLNVRFDPGEYVAIIGKNGTGKSTLLKLLNGLLRPTQGKVIIADQDIEGQSVAQITKTVGFIFQNPSMNFFNDTVEEEVGFSLKQHVRDTQEIKKRVLEILDQFHLTKYLRTYPRYLSIGEQQRLALAMVLIQKPRILLLDEPTHGMDYLQKQQFLQYLDGYRCEGNLVIVVTHDIESLTEFADRLIVLDHQGIAFDNGKQEIFLKLPDFKPQLIQLFETMPSVLSRGVTPEKILEVFQSAQK